MMEGTSTFSTLWACESALSGRYELCIENYVKSKPRENRFVRYGPRVEPGMDGIYASHLHRCRVFNN